MNFKYLENFLIISEPILNKNVLQFLLIFCVLIPKKFAKKTLPLFILLTKRYYFSTFLTEVHGVLQRVTPRFYNLYFYFQLALTIDAISLYLGSIKPQPLFVASFITSFSKDSHAK